MKLLVGIDGGGTKTDMVLCDSDGNVLKRCIGPATNPTSITLHTAKSRLQEMLKGILEDHGALQTPISGLYAGISGCGIPENQQFFESAIRAMLPNGQHIFVGSDAINAINSAIGTKDGLVAISGTGSCVYARFAGQMHRAGGWGYLLGDEGSGYDLGRSALVAALRAHDGRGSQTLLTELCVRQLGKPVYDAIPELYRDGKRNIASFAPCLMQAAESGDTVALQLLCQSAKSLCETIVAAGRWLPEGIVKLVVMSGSVWSPGGYYETKIAQRLGRGYKLIRADKPPVYGSLVEAAYQAGIPVGEGFSDNFSRSDIKSIM